MADGRAAPPSALGQPGSVPAQPYAAAVRAPGGAGLGDAARMTSTDNVHGRRLDEWGQ